jgi:hypothetical protein
LAAQVKRMLADDRAKRLSKNFVEQWLGLDGINSVAIDRQIHRGFNDELKLAMQTEPIAFFDEVLKQNSSVMDFIHSDYVVVNGALANHYGIKGVAGSHFRKVSIKPESNRGGILTTAAVMTMNSNGKDSHPLKRGIWLLEHVLNDPPPPPPPNVPEVDLADPKIALMTLKEQIEDHRKKPACISCHAKIDPWGIAFENYDAIGVYRTQIKGKSVDATSVLFNKQKLAGMDGLKRYVLTDRQDQFARAMVHKMTTYALGRPLSFSDRADIEQMATQFRKRGDRLGDLVHLIVASKLFQAKDFSGAAPGKTAKTPSVAIPRAPAKPAVTPRKPSKVPGNASDKTPAKARQWLSFAKSYIKAGRPDLARKDLNKILKTYPKSATAIEAKKLLVKIR